MCLLANRIFLLSSQKHLGIYKANTFFTIGNFLLHYFLPSLSPFISQNDFYTSVRNHHNLIIHCAGYSLTGRDLVSVEEVKNKMRECSLAMGLRQQTWLSKEPVIHSVATNLTPYLNALGSIIPQHFLSSYRSPCWRSPIILSYQQQKDLRLLDKKHMMTKVMLGYRENLKRNLYQSIFQPSLHKGDESLMSLPALFMAGFPKSGTTTLHTVLVKHEMMVKTRKERQW